jgi:SET domain-containing protein
MIRLIQNVKAAKSKVHGFGAFAAKNLRNHDNIEECPFIVSDQEDKNPERLQRYLFSGQTKKTTMLILGYGCIYNHADANNADYYYDDEKNVIVFYATAPIKKGKEIFVNYGNDYWASRRKKPD